MNSVPFSALLPPSSGPGFPGSWSARCSVAGSQSAPGVQEVGEKETGTLAISPAIHPAFRRVLQVCLTCSWKSVHRLLFISPEVAVGSRILLRDLAWHNAKATVGLKRAWAEATFSKLNTQKRWAVSKASTGRPHCQWKGPFVRALG